MSEKEPPVPLTYESSGIARAGGVVGRAIFGALGTVLLSLFVIAFLIGKTEPHTSYGVIGSAAYVAGTGFLGAKLYRSPKHRGWGLGIWIGLGLICLIEGACAVMLFRS